MQHRNRPFRSFGLLFGGLVLAMVLGACSGGGQVDADVSFDVTVADPEDAGVFALAQLMVGADAFGVTAVEGAAAGQLAPAGLTEVEPDIWLGNVVDASAGSTVEIVLPTEEELPPETLANVANAFPQTDAAADCQVDATTSTAVVTVSVFDFLTAPGLVSYGGAGLDLVLLSDSEVDLTATIPDGTRFYTWIHSDSAVDVGFSGSDCDGFAADLSLDQGWNVAAWVVDDTEGSVTLVNVERPDALVATVASGI